MTLDNAKEVFADLAQAKLRMVKRAAAAEVKLARIKEELGEANRADEAAVAEAEALLTGYIQGHRDQFRKPRQVKTEFGRFGLRDATRLQVDDEDALVEALMDLGYDDCMQVRRSIVKDAVVARIQGGEMLPGARVLDGDLVTYTVDKALVDAAAGEAE
jgi:hypothetical protein